MADPAEPLTVTGSGRRRRGLDAVLAWAKDEGYYGHSKFDAFNSPVVRAAVPNILLLRAVVAALWARSPVNPRPLLRTEKFRNPKGIGLFAIAYLRRYRVAGDPADLEEARALLAWLEEHIAPGYSGPCWGYDHDWYGLHFMAAKDSPNIIVTGNVAYAFTEAYEVTGDASYLRVAEGVVRFLQNDLGRSVDTPEMRNIGYIPGNVWGVININGIAASILSRVGKYTEDQGLADEARRLIAFMIDKQTPEGAWHYAWPAKSSNVAHDNYHTGNVLDWLLDYRRYTGDARFEDATRRGLEFFRRHLFEPDGLPKWRSDRTYPADAHGAGQALVTFSKAALELDPSFLQDARRVAGWTLGNLQHAKGYFHYQKGRFWTKRYTLMRWCNAWMAFGLASLLVAESEFGGGAD
ncbi:MAG: hypothetical protein AAGM22_13725 [Acidobacteriota bacterium]